MDGAGASIREATQDDIAATRALLVETWHDTYDALFGIDQVTRITDDWHSAENLQRQIGLPGTSFLVAEQDRQIVGHLFADARESATLLLSRLYVRPACQRHGLGARLLKAAMDAHAGCRAIRLEVHSGNAKGLAFYRREGFVQSGERSIDGISHIEMEKQLPCTDR